MKRILFILSLVLAVGISNAQDFAIKSGSNLGTYTGSATDLVVATGTLSKVCKMNRYSPYLYDVIIDIDTTGTPTGSVTVELEGSPDGTNYYDITSYTFYESADTVIRINNLTPSSSESIASYTITGSGTDTEAGTITGTVISDTAGVYATDTATYALATANTITNAGIETVATQTITVTGNTLVTYPYLKVKLTGVGASTAVELQSISIYAVKED